MCKMFRQIVFIPSVFTILLAVAATAEQGSVKTLTLSVGACPTPITIELRDSWLDAYESSVAADQLRNNQARRSIVAAVLLNDWLPGASISIMSLSAVDAAQGGITQEQFEGLKKMALQQAKDPDEWFSLMLQAQVEEFTQERAAEIADFNVLQNVITGLDQFIVIGNTSSPDASFLSAGVFRYINSCLINLIIGIPESFGPDALFEALGSVQVRE